MNPILKVESNLNDIKADLCQSKWIWVLYIKTSHLMSNLLLHVNVGRYLHGNSDREMKLA